VDIVLGVSLTPKTVRMVLVEGEKGDGAIVDHDTFDVSGGEGSATANVTDELVSAVLGTQESATEGGHVLKAIGVTWSDRTEAAALRDGLTARGITDVMLVSELHAAGALAQAAGRAVGYESTGLLFIDRDTATLSVVRSDDGSIVKVLSRSLHSTDALAVLADMVAAVERQDTSPQGMFVVGAGVDIASVKAHLADLVSIPVNAPEESGLALARGAALAAANAPAFDATTAGLAYALDPDGATAGNESVGLANASTQMAPVGGVAAVAPYQAYSDVDPAYDDLAVDDPRAEEGRKPFLLVGSALTSIFVLGVVALVISLAVSIRPTADQRPCPGQAAIIPSVVPPAAPPPAPEAAKPAAPAPPPAETIKAPVPVVQQAPAAPPRMVFVEPPQAPAPAPAAPPPAPAAPPPAPPVVAPVVPPVAVPPVWQPPVWQPPVQQRPIWQPPWQQQWPQRPPRDYDDYQPQRPPWQPPWQPPQQTQDPEPPVWQPPWQPQRPSRDEPEFEWPSQDNGNGNDNRNGNGSGSGRGSSEGSGGSQAPGANCFLIFCS